MELLSDAKCVLIGAALTALFLGHCDIALGLAVSALLLRLFNPKETQDGR